MGITVRSMPERGGVLLGLAGLTLLAVAGLVWFPADVPVSILLVPVLLGGLVLVPAQLAALSVLVLVGMVAAVVVSPYPATLVAGIVVFAGVLVAFWYATLRERWGFSARQGLRILFDLRDSLRRQARLPAPVPGWDLAQVHLSADGAALRGDFALAVLQGPSLRLAVVDVSGHGPPAAARATQLSGAFGALLAELSGEDFLVAANRYCMRQRWMEHFVTAAEVHVDVTTGMLTARSAGHPEVLVRRSDGQWRALPTTGAALGLRADPVFHARASRLRPGDLAVLLTDGLLTGHEDPMVASQPVRDSVNTWLEGGQQDSVLLAKALKALPELRVGEDDGTLLLLRCLGPGPSRLRG